MKKDLAKLFFIQIVLTLSACQSIEETMPAGNHSVMTIDNLQAGNLKCVFLYDTEVEEEGWNKTSAALNSLTVIKNQALIAGGNAVVIKDMRSSEDYQYSRYGDGYNVDTAMIYVDVYKCPFDEIKEVID